MEDDYQRIILEWTQQTKAFLVDEQFLPGEVAEIIGMKFILVSFVDDFPRLCYKLKDKKYGRKFVPVNNNGQKIISESERNYHCIDCAKNTLSNPNYDMYIVDDDLWKRYGCKTGMLCITCLQRRTGRQLTIDDFPAHELNINNRFIKLTRPKAKPNHE